MKSFCETIVWQFESPTRPISDPYIFVLINKQSRLCIVLLLLNTGSHKTKICLLVEFLVAWGPKIPVCIQSFDSLHYQLALSKTIWNVLHFMRAFQRYDLSTFFSLIVIVIVCRVTKWLNLVTNLDKNPLLEYWLSLNIKYFKIHISSLRITRESWKCFIQKWLTRYNWR